MQDGSPPPLSYTAEVGFFYIDIYSYIYICIYTRIRTCMWREGEQEDENEDEKDEVEEIGTDIRGHTEFLTSPGSL